MRMPAGRLEGWAKGGCRGIPTTTHPLPAFWRSATGVKERTHTHAYAHCQLFEGVQLVWKSALTHTHMPTASFLKERNWYERAHSHTHICPLSASWGVQPWQTALTSTHAAAPWMSFSCATSVALSARSLSRSTTAERIILMSWTTLAACFTSCDLDQRFNSVRLACERHHPGTRVWITLSWDQRAWITLSWDQRAWITLSWDQRAWITLSWDQRVWITLSWDQRVWITPSWDQRVWITLSWDQGGVKPHPVSMHGPAAWSDHVLWDAGACRCRHATCFGTQAHAGAATTCFGTQVHAGAGMRAWDRQGLWEMPLKAADYQAGTAAPCTGMDCPTLRATEGRPPTKFQAQTCFRELTQMLIKWDTAHEPNSSGVQALHCEQALLHAPACAVFASLVCLRHSKGACGSVLCCTRDGLPCSRRVSVLCCKCIGIYKSTLCYSWASQEQASRRMRNMHCVQQLVA